MKTFMFKRLRSALLVLPLLAAGALAGCTAQVGAPEDTSAQGADLVNVNPVEVAPTDQTQAPAPLERLLQNRAKPQRPVGPIDPDQVQTGTGNDPDPSPWVETPGSTDPDPSPWMDKATSASSQQTK